MPLFRKFAGLNCDTRLADESTILRFPHLLEEHELAPQILQTANDMLQAKGLLIKAGTVVGAMPIAAPSSTKNASGERDPEMVSGDSAQPRTTKKGNQWHFGVKPDAFGAAGYQSAAKRPDARQDVNSHVAMRPGKRSALDKRKRVNALVEKLEHSTVSIRAKAEHPFRLIKRQVGHVKLHYRRLKKNTAQLVTLFALSNLWMARRSLLILDGPVIQKVANAG